MKPMTPRTALLDLVVEQVMRLTDDDGLVLSWMTAFGRPRAAEAALGRLLCSVPYRLSLSSPIGAYLAGGEVDPDWRAALPGVESSLWSELGLLEALYGPCCSECVGYARLAHARELQFGRENELT
jgi:hypothetical protein